MLGRDRSRFIRTHRAKFFAIRSNDEDLRNANLMVNSVLIISRGSG